MKRIQLIATLLLFTCIYTQAQTNNWQWATSAPNANGIGVVDANGNVYVTGAFTGSAIIFGSDTLVNNDATGNTHDIFLVKFDASGSVIWAKSAGGSADDYGTAIAIDGFGHIYVAGLFTSTSLIFGTDTIADSTYNVLIVKYDTAGNFIRATLPGGTGESAGAYFNGLSTDAGGNVFATGYYGGSAMFFGSDTLLNAGNENVFVVKYDSSGNVIWANSAGGEANDRGNALATDAAGNVYITGGFDSPTFTAGSTSLTNIGSINIFVVKYNSSGSVVWAGSAGGNSTDMANGISTDANGNVYVTGYFSSSPAVFGSDSLASAGDNDIFLARYDSSGNVKWAKSAGGAFSDVANGIFTDASGNSYITGNFASTELFIGQDTLLNSTSNNNFDIFIAKYDSSGNVIWSASAGGDANDYGTNICADNNGNAYITGYYYSPNIPFGSYTLTTSNYSMFLAKYGTSSTGIVNAPVVVNNIIVYPNPSTGQFYFKGINSGSMLEIYDEIGQNIYSSVITGDTYMLNISAQAKGVYFYRVVDNNIAVQEGKMVVE